MTFTNEELRVALIPQAIILLSSDVFLKERNTANIASIVQELINIVRFGTPNVTEVPVIEAPEQDNQPQAATFA